MPRWPTRSRDPVVNILATGALFITIVLIFNAGLLVLAPVVDLLPENWTA